MFTLFTYKLRKLIIGFLSPKVAIIICSRVAQVKLRGIEKIIREKGEFQCFSNKVKGYQIVVRGNNQRGEERAPPSTPGRNHRQF